jgi:hypothetical protein
MARTFAFVDARLTRPWLGLDNTHHHLSMHRPLFSLRLPARRIQLGPLSSRNFSSTYEPTSTFRKAAYATLFTLTTGLGIVYYFDSRAAIHRYLITPVIRNVLDPESSHKLAVSVLENGLGPRDMLPDDERLETEVKGTTLALPSELKLTNPYAALGSNAVEPYRPRSGI